MYGLNLGNFGGQLNLDEINGALNNAGSPVQFADVPADAVAAPGPSDVVQAKDEEIPGAPKAGGISDAPLKGVINMKNIASMVGSYFGGPIGGQIGSMVGGVAQGNIEKQRAAGRIA